MLKNQKQQHKKATQKLHIQKKSLKKDSSGSNRNFLLVRITNNRVLRVKLQNKQTKPHPQQSKRKKPVSHTVCGNSHNILKRSRNSTEEDSQDALEKMPLIQNKRKHSRACICKRQYDNHLCNHEQHVAQALKGSS